MPAALVPGTNEEAAKRRSAAPAASGRWSCSLGQPAAAEAALGGSHSRAPAEAVHVHDALDQRRLRHQDTRRRL